MNAKKRIAIIGISDLDAYNGTMQKLTTSLLGYGDLMNWNGGWYGAGRWTPDTWTEGVSESFKLDGSISFFEVFAVEVTN